MDPADLGDRTDRNWTVTVDADPRLERVAEALCTLADGRFGTRGSCEEDSAGSAPLTSPSASTTTPARAPRCCPARSGQD
jgi:hypothetical protein